jgi:hypothetical protein
MNPTESSNTIIALKREIAALKERNQALEFGLSRLDKVRVDQSRLLEIAWAGIQSATVHLSPDPLPSEFAVAREAVATYFYLKESGHESVSAL